MNLVVWGNAAKRYELMQATEDVQWIEVDMLENLNLHSGADAFFLLDESAMQFDLRFTDAPVFIHAITDTLKDNQLPKNILRFNGWPGFIEKDAWEIAGELSEAAKHILLKINKQIIPVPDEIGMISARVIALIVNEAFYAQSDAVSTASEIDTAMKLGTNYPLGPFEWAEKIGIEEIYSLLQKLSRQDARYLPAASLKTKARI